MSGSGALLHAVDVRNVRMGQRRKNFGFTLELRELLAIRCQGLRQHFHRDLALQVRCGSVGYIGAPHSVTLGGADLFFRHVRVFGGHAAVRRYLLRLIDLVFKETINPGKA